MSNAGYAASLEVRKIYAIIDDPAAAKRGFVRVIDESGEDYLYPEARFQALPADPQLARALSRAI